MDDQRTRVRVPQQVRSREKWERLLKAATEQFSENGYGGTTAKGIAKQAGVSVGTFYAYFEDKKAILLTILGRHIDQVDASVFRILEEAIHQGATGREVLRLGIRHAHASHDQPPGLLRMMLGLRYSDADFAQFRESEDALFVERLVRFLSQTRNALRVDDLEAAAWMLCYAIEEVVHTSVSHGSPIGQDRLYNALADMTATYLFIDPDAPLKP